MNTPDTPEAVIRSLAQHLDGAGEGKPALKKVLLAHLKHLKPLRPTAGNADLESFYTVAAWYLTPTYLLKQPAVANDTDIIKGSRRITAMSHLSQVWGATAVTRIRAEFRHHLPLPTVPGRDFLQTLVKIATKAYDLKAFLRDLPRFVQSHLDTWRIENPNYFRQENHPCLRFSHVDAFYREDYQPRFLQNGKAIKAPTLIDGHPPKRQKISASGRHTRTTVHDEDVELPRRVDVPEREDEETLIQETSPAPSSSDASQQRTGARARHSDATLGIDRTITEDSELQLSIEESLIDNDLAEQTSFDEEDPVVFQTSEHALIDSSNITMRPLKPSADTIRANKEVQEKFNDFVQHTSGVNPALQWLHEIAKQREELRARKEAADEAFATADDKVIRLKEQIASKLPSGISLDGARTDARNNIKATEEAYNAYVALQNQLEKLLPTLVTGGLEQSATGHLQLNEASAAAVRMDRERKLKELDGLANKLREKEEDRGKKEDEANELENQFAELNTELDKTRAMFNMRQDNATFAALAKLQIPTPE